MISGRTCCCNIINRGMPKQMPRERRTCKESSLLEVGSSFPGCRFVFCRGSLPSVQIIVHSRYFLPFAAGGQGAGKDKPRARSSALIICAHAYFPVLAGPGNRKAKTGEKGEKPFLRSAGHEQKSGIIPGKKPPARVILCGPDTGCNQAVWPNIPGASGAM